MPHGITIDKYKQTTKQILKLSFPQMAESDFDEAINKLFGYIKCMVDMELIESDRAEEEMNIATKKLLDSKQAVLLFYNKTIDV